MAVRYANGTDGQTDGQTDRQTECDAIFLKEEGRIISNYFALY